MLDLSAREGRVLVSHNYDTMPRESIAFTARQRSPGVLLIQQNLPVAVAIETLLLVWGASEAADWENRLCLVPSLATFLIGGIE